MQFSHLNLMNQKDNSVESRIILSFFGLKLWTYHSLVEKKVPNEQPYLNYFRVSPGYSLLNHSSFFHYHLGNSQFYSGYQFIEREL